MKEALLHPVITARKHMPSIVRMRDIVLTILLWWAYFYFMKDLLFFIADVAHWAASGFAHTETYKSFAVLPTFLSYAAAMSGLAGLYICWALYNQRRFRGKGRRSAPAPVEIEELAGFYGLEAKDVIQWQNSKSMTIHHDSDGRIVKVDMLILSIVFGFFVTGAG